MICAKCGAQNPDGNNFCSSCGAALSTESQPQNAAPSNPVESAATSSEIPTAQAEPAAVAQPPATASDASAAAAQPAASATPNAATSAPTAGTAPTAPPSYADAPTAPPAYAGASAVPGPNPSGATPANSKVKKQIIIAVSAAAGLVLVAIIIAVAMVTCSGGGKPNVSDLVKADSEKIVSSTEGLAAVSLFKNTYYTPESMKDTIATVGKAFYDENEKALQAQADNVRKQDLWAISFFEQQDDSSAFDNLTIRDIKGKGDPSQVNVKTYRAPQNMTPEDVLKVAREFAKIDSAIIGSEPTAAGLQQYGDLTYCFGVGKGPGTVTRIRVDKLGDVYEFTLYTYSQNKLKDDSIDKLVSNFENGVDTYFKAKLTV